MNNEHNDVSQLEDAEKLKEIPKWTHRYAQNRTLTVFVYLLIVSLIGMLITVPMTILFAAFLRKNTPLALVGVVLLVAVIIFLYIFKKSNYKIFKWIDQRIYGHVGTVSIPEQKSSKKKKSVELATAIVLGGLFIGTMYLGMANFISVKYVQPVTALYYVPYMIFLYFWRSPMMGPICLLKPILYAIHAILIVAGVPMFFTGQFGVILNMSLPLIIYGFLTQIIVHIYSRYALKKLKDIAHLDGGSFNGV